MKDRLSEIIQPVVGLSPKLTSYGYIGRGSEVIAEMTSRTGYFRCEDSLDFDLDENSSLDSMRTFPEGFLSRGEPRTPITSPIVGQFSVSGGAYTRRFSWTQIFSGLDSAGDSLHAFFCGEIRLLIDNMALSISFAATKSI